MARGDVFYAEIPGGIGPHYSVIIRERDEHVIVIYGQSNAWDGSLAVEPRDPVAREFGNRLTHTTHFHKNSLAVLPVSSLPAARLGHIDDHDLPRFVKAANIGLVALGKVRAALVASGNRCQCQGGCKKHESPCPSPPCDLQNHAFMDWRLTPKNTVVCRSCWEF